MHFLLTMILAGLSVALAEDPIEVAVMVLVNGGEPVKLTSGCYCNHKENEDISKEMLKEFEKKDNLLRNLRTQRRLDPFWCIAA